MTVMFTVEDIDRRQSVTHQSPAEVRPGMMITRASIAFRSVLALVGRPPAPHGSNRRIRSAPERAPLTPDESPGLP